MNSNNTSIVPLTDNKSDVPAVDDSDHSNNTVDNNAKSPETGNNSFLFL